ncbi:hypothetical protein [Mycobacterium sp. NPDC050853]|uniref:hypothetical protein n=1 Tax=Mycobacteriaceae TaxID=1762 RepID=UPI001C6007E3
MGAGHPRHEVPQGRETGTPDGAIAIRSDAPQYLYAQPSDLRIGTITKPNSTEMRDGGSYDTSTVDKDITAVVSMTFGVQP